MPTRDDWELQAICIANLLKMNGSDKKCQCPECRGKKKAGRPKEVEFPELLKGAVQDERD